MVKKCQWVQLQDLTGHPMWKCGSDVPEENERAVNIIQSHGPVLLLLSVAKMCETGGKCYWIQAESTQPHFKVNGTILVHESYTFFEGLLQTTICSGATQWQYGSIDL